MPHHSRSNQMKTSIRTMDRPHTFDTLIDLAEFRCDAHPDRAAYVFLEDGQTPQQPALTYGGLLRSARAVASLLIQRGVSGSPVILAYEPGIEFMIAFWGCVLSGNVAVPVYQPRGAFRLRGLGGIVENCGATVALTHLPYLSTLRRAADPPAVLARVEWLCTDGDLPAPSSTRVCPHPLAVLQYTSGSTGHPKGVQITHRNVLSNEETIRHAFAHDEHTVVINCLPHHHDMGLFGNLLQPFYVGGLCVSMSPSSFVQKPLRWLEAISRYRATTSGGPGFLYDLCAARAAEQDLALDLESWSTAFIGAEPVRAETLQRFCETFAKYGFSRRSFRPCYGLAEATLLVSMVSRDVPRDADIVSMAQDRVSCGVSYGEQSFAIVNPQTRERCAASQEGEIWVHGSNVAEGYWRNDAATSETFGAFTTHGEGPFLRTGDCGYVVDGELFVSGRLSAFLIIDGQHYHAEDLEAEVARYAPALGIGRCAAICMNDAPRDEFVLIAEVARSAARAFDADAAGDAFAKALATAVGLVPRSIVFARPGGIPYTTSGKTQRQRARALLIAGELPVLAQWQRKDASENRPAAGDGALLHPLAAWLIEAIASRRVIDARLVSPVTPFASLGLDSKDLLELADQLSQRAGREVDPILMWECPNVEQLVQRLSEAGDVA